MDAASDLDSDSKSQWTVWSVSQVLRVVRATLASEH
jgi:hypothetical protein